MPDVHDRSETCLPNSIEDMRYRVELSAQAEMDVKEAYAFIREHGPANPDTWKIGLDERLASLETMPERCGLSLESRSAKVELRQVFHGTFRILFIIHKQTVGVVTMRHSARKPLSRDEVKKLANPDL